MRYLSEYRDRDLILKVSEKIHKITSRPWMIMEICGGQTHSIMRYGIDQLLPEMIELAHGPGCPVCVTPIELVDKAIMLASKPDVIFTSYGDMLRVPGSRTDLFSVRAQGGDIRIVYSPLDAVRIAEENPEKQVVFFAIGFETTAPANAASVYLAQKNCVNNYSVLVSQVRVPPAIHAILSSPGNQVQGFLAAGHVCSVMGYWEYLPIAEKYRVPIVVTGFEPLDILNGILKIVDQLEAGKFEVKNAYTRIVSQGGNLPAQALINSVFEGCDQKWRGIGMIPDSGMRLKSDYASFDAEKRFDLGMIISQESSVCIAGQILQGTKKPHQCPAFGIECSPENPLGATMVSSEGACAAYYNYGRKPEHL